MNRSYETIFVQAGEKIEIFKRRFSSVPMTYNFSAQAIGSKPLSGSLEVHRRKSVLLNQQVKTAEVKRQNTVHASMWDTFLTIYVIAENDMNISVPTCKITSLKPILMMVLLLIVVASSLLILVK